MKSPPSVIVHLKLITGSKTSILSCCPKMNLIMFRTVSPFIHLLLMAA